MTARAIGLLLLLGALACGGGVEALRGPWEDVPAEAADPALAVDEGGALLAAWVGGGGEAWDVWFARSADAGATWSAPVRVTTAPGQAHPHAEASPRLVAGAGGDLALVWTNRIPVAGREFPASDLWAAASSDGGRTWSAPGRVNDDAGGPPEGHTFHGAAWDGGTALVAAWLDGRGMPVDPVGTLAPAHAHGDPSAAASDSAAAHGHAASGSAVWTARSEDFGRTWGPNVPLWPSACPCCRVTLAPDEDGGLVAGWRAHLPGDVRDVVLAPIPAEGAVPAAPARVHDDGWVYPACPHSGPALARAGDALHVAWYTGREGGAGVWYARAGGAPIALATGAELPVAHPAAVALDDGGAAVVWDVAADGGRRLTIARVTADGAVAERVEVPGSDDADHPRLARVAPDAVVVAWTVPGERSSARLARVRLGS